MTKMYPKVETWNCIGGCGFFCSYCWARQQLKRSGKKNPSRYNFEPHIYRDRLVNQTFKKGSVIFVGAIGDIAFSDTWVVDQIFEIIEDNPETTFYIQTKNPRTFRVWDEINEIPVNVVVGTTAETDYDTKTISQAPSPINRMDALCELKHKRKFVTVEPILKFTPHFTDFIKMTNPEFVYLGYDNYWQRNRLNEPPWEDVWDLSLKLKEFTEVRWKTLRPAWWEINKAECLTTQQSIGKNIQEVIL